MSEAKILRNPQVAYRSVGDGGVLLHLETGAYHGLNAVGAAVWELIDGERSRSEIVSGVRKGLQDPPPQMEAEVSAFLDGLRERDLISE